jgi:glycerophosphoryl diester phosphodiesterase
MLKWNKNKVIILGHRGFMAKYPENTLLSFRKAIEAGADGVELDVWLSKDEHLVVIHDESIDRTSDMKGKQKEMTLNELKKANLSMGQKIPTLEEVFEALPSDALIDIELKDVDAVKRSLKVVHDFRALERVMISSFNVETLKRVREVDKEVALGLLVGDEKIVSQVQKLGEMLNLYSMNVPVEGIRVLGFEKFRSLLSLVKSLGLKVVLWTGNDELYYENNNLRRLLGTYDIVIANDVEKAVKYLSS